MNMNMTEWVSMVEGWADTVPQEGWWAVGGAALLCLIWMLRPKGRSAKSGGPSSEKKIPEYLRSSGAVFDLFTGEDGSEIQAAKCVITGRSGRRLRCETVEDIDLRGFKPGMRLTASFRPLKVRGKSVNSFFSTFAELEVVNQELVRFLMEPPASYALVRRRKHPRKRVLDQQFIRVRLWFAGPKDATTDFQEGVPDLSVNSYDVRSGKQGGGSVVNISKGGMGIRVGADEAPDLGAARGEVVINLFMFNYREKTFKPYWYTGTIRSLDPDGGAVRLGIEFTGVAGMDENGELNWSSL